MPKNLLPSPASPPSLGFRASLSILAMAALAACTNLAPSYTRPSAATPAAWQTKLPASATEAPPWPAVEWWTGFKSPQLTAYLEQARTSNYDLAAAVARIREADAQARIAGAPLLPTVSANAVGSRQRAPVSGVGIRDSDTFSPTLGASYQLDFWGKNQNAADAAQAMANASRYDKAVVELTVQSSVATSYFQLLALNDRIRIAESNYKNASEILRGLQLQQNAGIATALDVAQQSTVVANLSASIPPLKLQARQTADALAILIGKTPDAVRSDVGGMDNVAAPVVGAGIPSQLLARRPDVAEAEAQLIAANANIGVARAALFPSVTLTTSGGFISGALSGLVSPANRIWAFGAALAQPIFDGGALRGQVQYSEARKEELTANYQKAMQTAFANVDDALVAVEQTADQQKRQQVAVEQAQRAYGFAKLQMQAGTINVLTLLNTQTAMFAAQDALAQVKMAHLQAIVALYKALGGGWQQSDTH